MTECMKIKSMGHVIIPDVQNRTNGSVVRCGLGQRDLSKTKARVGRINVDLSNPKVSKGALDSSGGDDGIV